MDAELVFGDKASGQRPPREYVGPRWERQIEATKGILGPHGPFICRLCGMVAERVAVSVRNIAGTGFRAFPCCADRDACRERREMQGKSWPLIDASLPSIFAPAVEEETEERMPVMSSILVTLNAEQIAVTETHAQEVWDYDRAHGYAGKFDPGRGETPQSVNLRGFGAEMAAHIALGIPLRWEMHDLGYQQSMKTADLRARTDVKNPRYRRHRLWCGPEDKKYGRFDWSFLKVSGEMPTFLIEGWAYGHEIMIEDHFVRNIQRPAYFLPNEKLRPLPLPPEEEPDGPAATD